MSHSDTKVHGDGAAGLVSVRSLPLKWRIHFSWCFLIMGIGKMTEELSSKREVTKYQCVFLPLDLYVYVTSSVRKVKFTQPYKALFSIDIYKLVSGLFPVNCSRAELTKFPCVKSLYQITTVRPVLWWKWSNIFSLHKLLSEFNNFVTRGNKTENKWKG